jgi:hypothetical protein
MKLALYAHYSTSDAVARHVLYYLQKLGELGFQVHFISNSPVSSSSQEQLNEVCDSIIQRENTGLDFGMWQRSLAECDLNKVDELLLTNSSIIGPLQPLGPLWEKSARLECDFWGLTDNDQIAPHLQSYFLVFCSKVIRSSSFLQFWKSVLPYRDKDQVIRSYEVGLTIWLEENGFKSAALFPQQKVFETYIANRKRRSFLTKVSDRIENKWKAGQLPGRNTSIDFAETLIASGMPFLKLALLKYSYGRMRPKRALELLQMSGLPKDAVDELQSCFGEKMLKIDMSCDSKAVEEKLGASQEPSRH